MKIVGDKQIMVLAVWAEAEGESLEGKQAVAEVIARRCKRHYMSDGTVAGTVALRYQFSALNDDRPDNQRLIAALKIDDSDPIVQDCIWAVEQVLRPGYKEIVPDAVVYFNPAHTTHPPACATGKNFVRSIGNHVFYRDPPAA